MPIADIIIAVLGIFTSSSISEFLSLTTIVVEVESTWKENLQAYFALKMDSQVHFVL